MSVINKKYSKAFIAASVMLLVSLGVFYYSLFLYFLLLVPFTLSWIVFILIAFFRIFKKRGNGLPLLFVSVLSILVSILILKVPHPDPAFITDKDIVQNGFYPSPDNKTIIVEWMRDLGGFGNTENMISIISAQNKDKEELFKNRFSYGDKYKFSRWLNNDTAEFVVDTRSYESKREKFKSDVELFNGVKISIKEKGFDTTLPLFIESRIESPDQNYEIVAYRYKDEVSPFYGISLAKGESVNDLHISIVKKGDEIPSIGNVYNSIKSIGGVFYGNNPISGDEVIYFGQWDGNKSVIFYTTDESLAKRQLENFTDFSIKFTEQICPDVKNNPKECPTQLYKSGWFHQPQYSNLNRVKKELKEFGEYTFATIVDEGTVGDGDIVGLLDVAYVYEYKGRKYLGILRKKYSKEKKSKSEIGKKIKIIFSTKTPDIHQLSLLK